MHFRPACFLIAVLLVAASATSASAISVEVAKKCEALMAKQFPPRVAGNPAAGSAKGSAKDQRDYFQKCVDADGKIDQGDAAKSK